MYSIIHILEVIFAKQYFCRKIYDSIYNLRIQF